MTWLAALVLAAVAPVELSVAFHVARPDGQPVVDEAWITARIEAANKVMGPHGVRFRVSAVHDLDPSAPTQAITRDDRDAFGAHLLQGPVNVFVVARLEDIHEPGKIRRGVHWRTRADRRRRYVIVAAYSRTYVLAHELGHYLGHPKHSDVAGNLMSYKKGKGPPTLDEKQGRGMRAAARRLARRSAR